MSATDVLLSTADMALKDEIVREIEELMVALGPHSTVSKFTLEIIVWTDGFAPAEVREAIELAVMADSRNRHLHRIRSPAFTAPSTGTLVDPPVSVRATLYG